VVFLVEVQQAGIRHPGLSREGPGGGSWGLAAPIIRSCLPVRPSPIWCPGGFPALLLAPSISTRSTLSNKPSRRRTTEARS
jgi:hypothetical protein